MAAKSVENIQLKQYPQLNEKVQASLKQKSINLTEGISNGHRLVQLEADLLERFRLKRKIQPTDSKRTLMGNKSDGYKFDPVEAECYPPELRDIFLDDEKDFSGRYNHSTLLSDSRLIIDSDEESFTQENNLDQVNEVDEQDIDGDYVINHFDSDHDELSDTGSQNNPIL